MWSLLNISEAVVSKFFSTSQSRPQGISNFHRPVTAWRSVGWSAPGFDWDITGNWSPMGKGPLETTIPSGVKDDCSTIAGRISACPRFAVCWFVNWHHIPKTTSEVRNFAHHGNWEVWYMGSVWNFFFREPQKLEASKFSGESSFSLLWHYGIFHVPPASPIDRLRSCLHGSRSLPAWQL